MYCDGCGNQLTEGAAFCSKCGKAVGKSRPAPTARGRVGVHLQLLAILWIAIGVFRLIPALVMFGLSSAPFMMNAPMMIRGMFPMLAGIFSLFGAASIVTGVALLTRQSWGRMMAIVFGALNLVDVPFGTAIGVYSLWTMLPEESEAEYEELGARAGAP